MPVLPQNNPNLISNKEKQPTPKGTGFVNLQKYLGANVGSKLGGAVTGGVQQAGQKAQETLGQQQQQFGQQLQQARTGTQKAKEVVGSTLSRFDQPGQFQGVGQPELEQFKSLRESGYIGPRGYEDTETLQKQAQRAGQLGELTQSRGGRQEILRQTIQAPKYTAAQQRLDELMLSLGGGAKDLRTAGRGLRKTPGQIQSEIQKAAGTGAEAEKQYEDVRGEAAKGIQTRESSLSDVLNKQLEQARSQESTRQAKISEFKNAIASGDIGRAQAIQNEAKLFDPQMAQDIAALGQAGSRFASQVAGAITPGMIDLSSRGQTASEIQRAQANALAQLAGRQGEFEGFTPAQREAARLGKVGPESLIPSLYEKYGFNEAEFNPLLGREAQEREAARGKLTGALLSSYLGGGVNRLDAISPERKQHVTDTVNRLLAGQQAWGGQWGIPLSQQANEDLKRMIYDPYMTTRGQLTGQQQARQAAVSQYERLLPILQRYQ